MTLRGAVIKLLACSVLICVACGRTASAQEVIVAPIFSGSGGNTSYLRIFNPGSASTTATVMFRGNASSQLLGQATVTVPAKASPQWSISQLLTLANLTQNTLGEYSLRIRRGTSLLAFQHIIYNSTSNFFQNVTVCAPVDDASLNSLGSYLINLHTGAIAGFPSKVVLQNPAAAAVTTRLRLFDAGTGADLGVSESITMAAGETRSLSLNSLAEGMDLVFTASQFHINVRAEVGSLPYRGFNMAHAVDNVELNQYLNLTPFCPVPST